MMLYDEKNLRRQVLKRFKHKPNGLYSVHDYNKDKFMWLGVVVEKKGSRLIILSVGCELTKAEIITWCNGVVDNRASGGGPKTDPKDMKDRSN